jgi:phosphoesterase RecJ-like protein
MDDLKQLANQIKQAKRVAIFTHMRPDGDAIGGSLALSCALEKMGIQTQVCVESEIPSNLTFLEGVEKIQKFPTQPFELLILLDCADENRLGALWDEFLKCKRKKIDTINIDHHVSNTRFAKYNFVQNCASNCLNVAKLIKYLGGSFDKNIAQYLMVGLLTDSGNLSHDDVNEECFSLAGQLVASGADVTTLTYQLFKRQSKARAALYAKTMSGIRYFHDDRFALIVITREAMQACSATQGDTEGFVDFPLNIDGVEVAAALMEVKFRQYKVSLRSKKYADVNQIAGKYGGGGHVRASGCMLFGDLEDVIDRLSFTVSQYLED